MPADNLPRVLALDAVPLGLAGLANDDLPVRAQVELGRRLFFDGVLSGNGKVSCASCHDPGRGFASADLLAVGIGGERGRRHAPALINRRFGRAFFWDGRAATLEEQALKPIASEKELGSSVAEVLTRLGEDATYREAFATAFEDGLTAANLARALASFQRAIVSGSSPVDRFIHGEVAALTDAQRQGLWLFESRGGCWKCHSGANYTDEAFHNTGVSWGREPLDLGRYEVTRNDDDRGRFKTPTLRSVALSPPYMHDGSLPTLRSVVEFYNRGGVKNPHLDRAMQPLDLSAAQVDQLVAFLEALTGAPLKDAGDLDRAKND